MTRNKGLDASNIRIALVDDDAFVRGSLVTILSAQPDMEICGEAGNGFEAISLYNQIKPDVMLMDIQMPQCSGLQAAPEILKDHPEARLMYLTTFSDDEYIVSALRLGARGYLIKQEVATIAPAIRSVIAGQMVLAGEVIERVDLLIGLNDGAKKVALEHEKIRGFTERELEIIELIAQGLDNKEIAAKIFISEGTVRNHVSAILLKLSLKNRTQIAVYYYKCLGR